VKAEVVVGASKLISGTSSALRVGWDSGGVGGTGCTGGKDLLYFVVEGYIVPFFKHKGKVM
jgi:hypothetical protein